jgi:hypothetical protein
VTSPSCRADRNETFVGVEMGGRAADRSLPVETVMRADARRAAESEEWSLRGLLPFLSAILLEFE